MRCEARGGKGGATCAPAGGRSHLLLRGPRSRSPRCSPCPAHDELETYTERRSSETEQPSEEEARAPSRLARALADPATETRFWEAALSVQTTPTSPEPDSPPRSTRTDPSARDDEDAQVGEERKSTVAAATAEKSTKVVVLLRRAGSGLLGLDGAGDLLALGEALGDDDLVLGLLRLLRLGLAALERAEVAAALEALRGNETLDL